METLPAFERADRESRSSSRFCKASKSQAQQGAIQRQIEATDAEIDRLVYELYGLTDEEIALLTPVVRCYRTYSIEFKTDGDGKLQHVARADRQGRTRLLPVVFDLTPDL